MMEWTPEQIATLRSQWNLGASAAEIGRRMGLSKNSIVGKAHRLGLPSRPSPIKTDLNPDLVRAKDYQRNRRQRQHAATLKPLASLQATTQAPPPPKPNPIPRPMRVMPPPIKAAPPEGPVCECRWPIGEVRSKEFRFCEAPSVPGKSYCLKHCKIAYQPMRDLRDLPGWQPGRITQTSKENA